MEQEKLYLVCENCGEAFDELQAAKAHEIFMGCEDETVYRVLPESEAM